MNYAAHAAESGAAPPEQPVIFYKAPNTVVGPYDDVLIPRGSTRTDWEVELAVVIGRRARYLDSPEAALAHIAGYAIANDVSERDFQLGVSGGQWSKGKSLRDVQPAGPVAGHRRRGGRPAGAAACAPGSTASRGRTPAPRT